MAEREVDVEIKWKERERNSHNQKLCWEKDMRADWERKVEMKLERVDEGRSNRKWEWELVLTLWGERVKLREVGGKPTETHYMSQSTCVWVCVCVCAVLKLTSLRQRRGGRWLKTYVLFCLTLVATKNSLLLLFSSHVPFVNIISTLIPEMQVPLKISQHYG